MSENGRNPQDVAATWLRGLQARGVKVILRNGRIVMVPERAYKDLSDDERATLRHHREAIKELVSNGEATWPPSPPITSASAAPIAEPDPPCPFCYHAPCMGEAHPAFFTLHPHAPRPPDKHATAVMLARIGQPHPWDY